MVELTAAAGIAPPSFYAAFGSKAAAFCEAVDHCGQIPPCWPWKTHRICAWDSRACSRAV
ncbi:TetR/AcrR family transcriptional regulator [Kerstersia gyiorum]|nr:TetR/AcrR family transcriptional regulator [Kerstersia gyiorum]QBR42282.1 TetR/AcrR family transcriptional regulator [Kerstersia gyiorum]